MIATRPRSRPSASLALVTLVLGIAVAHAALAPADAEARPRPAGKSRKSNFEANKTFGLGIMLGAPTGLSGKYYLSASTAIDFGVGTIYGYRDRHGLHLHADHLWHPVSLVSAPALELPLYVGIGARYLNGDRCYQYAGNGRCDVRYDDYAALGVRAPIGLALDFNNVPIDIFFELALVLDLVVDRDEFYDDNTFYIDLNGAIGFRYYFN